MPATGDFSTFQSAFGVSGRNAMHRAVDNMFPVWGDETEALFQAYCREFSAAIGNDILSADEGDDEEVVISAYLSVCDYEIGCPTASLSSLLLSEIDREPTMRERISALEKTIEIVRAAYLARHKQIAA